MVGGSIPRAQKLWFGPVCTTNLRKQEATLSRRGPNKGLADLKELIEAGKFLPVVDSTYPLNEVPEAIGGLQFEIIQLHNK
jgi:NADPH:quinone reductase-like Zn-dependent oxidoreductase